MESIDEFKSSNTKYNNDETYMQRAIKAAVSSIKRGDVPFGAVVVQGDKIIAVSGNGELSRQDVTQHAEVRAISKASQRLGRRDLSDCTIYSTVEPCPMCSGAIFYACAAKVVYAMSRDDLPHLFRSRKIRFQNLADDLSYTPEIISGVCRQEAMDSFSGYKEAFRVSPEERLRRASLLRRTTSKARLIKWRVQQMVAIQR